MRKPREAARRASLQACLRRNSRAHHLVPLELAVRTVFTRVYSERLLVSVPVRSTAHLDGLAYTMTELTPIYVYRADGGDTRALSKAELEGGHFWDGAKELYFVDGRPALKNLAVKVSAIGAVVKALSSFSFDDR